MEEDVLLPIGSLVRVTPRNDEQTLFIIIGKRIINHETLRAWDYISVAYHNGLKRHITKELKNEDNFFYFNHYEIEELVLTFSLPEGQTDSTTEEE